MSTPSSAEASRGGGQPTAVERAAAEPNLSSETNQLEAALLASPKLPNFAGVGQLIGELEECPDTDVTAVHSVIAGDGPLAKEVVRIVNAPLYKLPREVRSVREAVLIMDIEPLRNLALALVGGEYLVE